MNLGCGLVLEQEILLAHQWTHSLKTCARLPVRGWKDLTPSQPGSEFQPGMVSSVGDPTRSNIIWAWLRSLLPAKIGLPLNISPKTQLFEAD